MRQISIPLPVRESIASHSISAYPNEGCGVLFGLSAEHVLSIVGATGLPNRSSSPGNRYEIDPIAYAKAERQALTSGLCILGFFHSHPESPARPSLEDLQTARGLFEFSRTYYVYAIQSVVNGQADELTFWELSRERDAFVELQIV